VGARPLALTDNLNFGSPERPEIMGQLVGCIRGIAEACKALDFPVVSGNVSLYNETNGKAILPTPTIGGVGLLDDFTKSAAIGFKREGDAILLVGESVGWLGRSLYLRDICGRDDGAPPPVDLTEERENGDFVRALIGAGLAGAVHDVSDGGLLVALAEMAMVSGIGAALDAPPSDIPAHSFWFGEDQARYVVTVAERSVKAVVKRAAGAAVPVFRLGTTGGASIVLPGERPILIKVLLERFEGWLPGYMAGGSP
jgi:phosphoribosylformylglycinamidine synthase